jgi:hypothetical protein
VIQRRAEANFHMSKTKLMISFTVHCRSMYSHAKNLRRPGSNDDTRCKINWHRFKRSNKLDMRCQLAEAECLVVIFPSQIRLWASNGAMHFAAYNQIPRICGYRESSTCVTIDAPKALQWVGRGPVSKGYTYM